MRYLFVCSSCRSRVAKWLIVLMSVGLLAGCGPSTGRLSGKVLFKGQPMPSAEIEIAPVGDTSKNYRGVSVADGAYHLDYGLDNGLPFGNYTAAVTIYLTPRGQPLPEGEAGISLRNSGRALVRRYVLDLTVDKTSQNVDLNLDQGKLEPAGS